MTSKEESRFSMQLVSRDYLRQNVAITATLPNFAVYFAVIESDIPQVSLIREQQELDKKGFATNKRLLRIGLIAQAIDVARRIVAYASNVNNEVLLEEVNYSERKLKNSADTILKDRCRVIYNKGIENVAELQAYGVTDAVLTSLSDTINNYFAEIPKPKLGTTETKEATRKLKLLLKKIDVNYAKIDVLVEMVKGTELEFYSKYKTVRRVTYSGGQTLALKVLVKDINGNAVPSVTAIITNIPQNPHNKEVINEISKKTSVKGAFQIVNLIEGNYKVIIKKLGYIEKSQNFSVVNGETTELNFVIEANG